MNSRLERERRRTSNIRIIRRNICKVQRELNLREGLRRDRRRHITRPDEEVRVQIEYLGIDVVELEWEEVALRVDFEVEVGSEREVRWGAREDRCGRTGSV